jgi:hypothetical protein
MSGFTNTNMSKTLIKVGNKVYAKSLSFGNQKAKTVHKNKKAYDRKKEKCFSLDSL